MQFTDENTVPCLSIHNATDQCKFYNETEDCHDSDGKLDYMYFIFCVFQEQPYVAVFLCVLWLLLLFIALGVTADDFLCPSLVVITKTLHLSQNIAGVTFLAFGNGAPDIFSSVAGIEQSRPELVIGTLFGAGIFVTSVVAGSIVVSRPFQIMERPFLRDIIFYICATFWAFLRFYQGEISLEHSIGFVALYILYILVVIISRIVYNKYREKRKTPKDAEGTVMKAPAVPTISVQIPQGLEESEGTSSEVQFKPNPDVDDPEAEGVVLRRFSFRGSIPGMRYRRSSSHAHHEHVLKSLTQAVDHHPNPTYKNAGVHPPPLDTQLSKTSMSSLLSKSSTWDHPNQMMEFFLHVCPVDIDTWPERKWYFKILDIVKAPICFLLIITIPVVDYENDKSNWCRLLNSIHFITAPMFVVAAVGEYDSAIGDVVPVWAVVLAVSVVLAIAIFFTSSDEEPPCYHWLFGYIGFGTSVIWIYLIASEIVSLLKAIGIVFRLSDAILGLTVLAWGNSIGDYISNLSVARQGYPRMGISACYGGPLLNLLLGIGIPYTVMIAKQGHPLDLQFTRLISLLYGTLTIILVSSIITMTVLRFNAKRYFGIFLLCCYVIFLAAAILLESKVI